MNAIATVSTVINLVGVVITAVGLIQPWRDFAPDGERFWRAPPIGSTVDAVLRRLLRRPRQVAVTATGGIRASGHGCVTVTMARLPALDDPGFRDEVQNRIDRLHAEQQAEQERTAEAVRALRRDAEAIRDELPTRIKDAESLTRDVAVGGVRLEAFGLAIVALGTVLGALRP